MEFNLNLSTLPQQHKAVPLDDREIYDILIIGGGPAALTAAVYAMRKGVKTGFAALELGGQVSWTSSIENYLGYKHIEGIELVNKFKEQVQQFEIGFQEGEKSLKINDGKIKNVFFGNGKSYQSKAVIIATGKSPKMLNVPGEKELLGRGVAYCSICDAPLFAGKDVAVVGGGNSGIESAIDLAKAAESVTLIQFLDKLTADEILIDALNKFKNVKVLLEHKVTSIKGNDSVESVTVLDKKNDEKVLSVSGIFIEIGLTPNSEPAADICRLNEFGEIIIDCSCRTSCPGIFAAGDVTTVPYKQIIIAAGEGAKAALSACDYVLKEFNGR